MEEEGEEGKKGEGEEEEEEEEEGGEEEEEEGEEDYKVWPSLREGEQISAQALWGTFQTLPPSAVGVRSEARRERRGCRGDGAGGGGFGGQFYLKPFHPVLLIPGKLY